MSNVSLTDQMGAMALVDELRYSQAEIQKHLDLPGHRRQVAERIREFYRSKGVEVDDALVEEGVRNFFASRLIYQAPTIGPVSRRLARAYIGRDRWLRPTIFVLAAFMVVLVIGNPVSNFFGRISREGSQMGLDKAREQVVSHAGQVEQLDKRVATLKADPLLANAPAAQRLLEQARSALDKSRSLKLPALPEHFSNETRDAEYKLKNTVTELLDKDNADLQALTEKLDTLTAQAIATRPLLKQLQDARDSVRGMGLNSADSEQFQPLFARAEQAIRVLDAPAAEQALADAGQLRDVAATPLTLEVVSRAGEKSLVERNYDPNGSKTWYLLTEATDAAGNVVAVPITSVESGERRYAAVFGVRVNQATYQAVRRDKEQDGHVDDRLVGRKAANSLSFKFLKGPVKGKADYILEWQ
ncbi:DUF6384 family protein [Pseudomonas gingeri]|uniref:DUF6384 family protein n=1 Tax=Pseudomonas gingeri TaxID=117681 RepID=UPI0034E947A3